MTHPAVAALSPERAARDGEALTAETVDVLVVGGGVVGAGVALDAATRGLSVGLVEAEDWAAGTSSSSSKLIHGGLRYLRTRDFALVREALRERSLLLELAPHLVHQIEFLYPLRRRIERSYVGAGVGLYDLLARVPGASAPLPRARHLSTERARALAPSLRHDRLRGAVVYSDAQVDDARFVLQLVRTAASHGARVLTRARVVSLGGGVDGTTRARVRFTETGEEHTLAARTVVAAAGVWSEELAAMAGFGGLRLRPSKGVHLVVGRAAIDLASALIVPTRASVLFVLPWGGHWIIGTTDTPWNAGPARPVATRSDIDYLLGELNAVLVSPLGRGDLESVYAGLRPLLEGATSRTTRLSREHAVALARPGLVLVAGGKYTTYRVMAREAVDAALASVEMKAPASRTEEVALAGASGFARRVAARGALAREHGLGAGELERLLRRYGDLVDEVLATTAVPEPLRPLRRAPGYLRAEIAYAVTHEGARHLDDVLVRRTRAAIETRDRGVGAAAEVAELVSPLLGWSRARTAEEVARYAAGVRTTELAERVG